MSVCVCVDLFVNYPLFYFSQNEQETAASQWLSQAWETDWPAVEQGRLIRAYKQRQSVFDVLTSQLEKLPEHLVVALRKLLEDKESGPFTPEHSLFHHSYRFPSLVSGFLFFVCLNL